MRFEHPVPAPQRIPAVPMRLGLLVRMYLPGATRIDVQVAVGTGWRKVNGLHLDEGDHAVGPVTIAAIVKACADHHAAQVNAGGKYQAMLWRYDRGELDHKKARFDVELARPAKRSIRPAKRSRSRARGRGRSPQRTSFETMLMLEEILATSTGPAVDRMAALRREIASPLDRVQRELMEMSAIYDEGSSTGTAEGLALAELRIRSKLAGLRGQEDGDVWTAIAPFVEDVLARLRASASSESTAAGEGAPAEHAGAVEPKPVEHDASEPSGASST